MRVLADAVLSKTNDESMRQRAVEWGCETMELDTDKYAELAIEQATFELQAEVGTVLDCSFSIWSGLYIHS